MHTAYFKLLILPTAQYTLSTEILTLTNWRWTLETWHHQNPTVPYTPTHRSHEACQQAAEAKGKPGGGRRRGPEEGRLAAT